MRWTAVPNILTVTRLVLTIPICMLVFTSRETAALIVYLIAVLTDLDGWVARKTGSVSKLGTALDPVADGVLSGGVLLALVLLDRFSLVVLLLFLLAGLIRGACMLLVYRRKQPWPSSLFSKSSGILLFLLVPWAMLDLPGLWPLIILTLLVNFAVALKRVRDYALARRA